MPEQCWKLEVVGGADGIGRKNCLLLSVHNSKQVFMIDCGGTQEGGMDLKNVESWQNDEMLLTLITRYEELLKAKKELVICVTHYHFDHVGRIPFFLHLCDTMRLPLPTIISHAFTIDCIRKDIESMYFFAQDNPFEANENGNPFEVQKSRVTAFPFMYISDDQIDFHMASLTAIEAVHSVYAAQGYCFQLRKSKNDQHPYIFVYTGDYKWLEVASSPEFRGADLLLTDSTSITRTDAVSEEEAVRNVMQVYKHRTWHGPTFISLFSTNVERLHAIICAANALGITPFIHSVSIISTYEIYLSGARVKKPRYYTQATPKEFTALNNNSIIITSGVWGQGYVSFDQLVRMSELERSSVSSKRSGLARLACGGAILKSGSFAGIRAFPGSGVILSGSLYPFVRKNVEPMLYAFKDMGVEVVVDASHTPHWKVFEEHQFPTAYIHSSGHANKKAFERVIKDLAPKKIAAFHCDQHGRTACHAFATKMLKIRTLDLHDGGKYTLR